MPSYSWSCSELGLAKGFKFDPATPCAEFQFSSVVADQCKGRCWVKGLWKHLIIKILKLKAKASDYACREHPQDCLLHHTPHYAITQGTLFNKNLKKEPVSGLELFQKHQSNLQSLSLTRSCLTDKDLCTHGRGKRGNTFFLGLDDLFFLPAGNATFAN